MKRIVLAVLAVLCLSPAVANAGGGKWLWQDEGVTITEGEKVPIVAWGSITLTGTSGVTGELICRTSGSGYVDNKEGHGELNLIYVNHYQQETFLISNCTTFTICPTGTVYAQVVASESQQVGFLVGSLNSEGKLNVTWSGAVVECFSEKGRIKTLQYIEPSGFVAPVELGTSALHPGFLILTGKLKSTFEVTSEVTLSGYLKFLGSEAQELINKHDPPGTPARHARRHRHHHRH